ncbi:MAG: response regulator [Eubacterium sp.]|jgi:CheY-like chemotaxis protein|nr:response regulator [Eubacterium sp.]
MQNILIVAEAKSHLLMSITEHFEKVSYQVFTVPADIESINDVKETFQSILIYADDKLLDQHPALYFIKDHAVMSNIPIFILGNLDELTTIKSIIPKGLINKEFLRPISIHVRELVDKIDNLIKIYNTNKKKKILVVDDSGAMLRNVKGWLENKYNVFLANSGAMAIKYLALNRPDLVLLDYEMPVIDGKQVLEMIRTEKEFTDIPVMFLTIKGDAESIMKVKDLKPEGYLLKTLEPYQIVKAIDDFFELRKGLI